MQCSHTSYSRASSESSPNQDFLAADDCLGAYLISDGIGGHRGGAVAAQVACTTALTYLQDNKHSLKANDVTAEGLKKLCSAAVFAANAAVHQRSQSDSNLSGMGTTLTMVVIVDGLAVVAHVGSSRAYLCRDGKLIQLTKDHTLRQALIERGVVPETRADTIPHGRALFRAVGLLEAVTPDVLTLDVLPGDRVLLATDGATNSFSHDELQRLAVAPDGGLTAQALIEAASSRGLGDDATAIVIAPAAEPQDTITYSKRSEQVLLKTDSLREMFLFRELEPQIIMEIVNQSALVFSKAGDILFTQGTVEQNLYIILEGTFDVIVDGTTIAELTKGSHFGEMAWLSAEPRSATIRCSADGSLLRISSSFLQGFILRSPESSVYILRALARELSRRLRATNALALASA